MRWVVLSLAIVFLFPILSACANEFSSLESTDNISVQAATAPKSAFATMASTQATSPTQIQTSTPVPIESETCPITPVYMDFWVRSAPAAGEFPVWMTSHGQSMYSQLGPIVLPITSGELDFVEGRFTKDLVFVDQSIEGDLTITGQHINGDVIVYFPDEDDTIRVDERTLQLVEIPPQEHIIRSAHKRTRSPNPSGKAHYGMALLYTNPGCYQFTLDISGFSVQVVIEILEE